MSLAASAALVAAPGIIKAVQAADVSSSHPANVIARVAADRSLLAGAERVVLAFGSRGPLVAAAQQRLNETLPNTHLMVDGIFGPLTQAAVIDFQKRYGLAPTGEIDALTWATLFKAPVLLLASPPGSQPSSTPSTYQATTAPYPTSSGAGSAPVSTQTAGPGIGAQSNVTPAPGVAGSVGASGHSGVGSGVGAVSPVGNGQSAPPPSNGGTSVGNRGVTGRPPSGTSPITVVSPGNPSTGPSTYVLSNGVALPLPRQYLVNGSVDQGVDYSAPGGTPLYAMGDGIIIGEGIGGFGPNAPVLEITSGPLSGLEIYYGHAGPDLVRIGQRVTAGQQISEVGYGIVGISTGPHLEIGFYPPGPLGAGSRMLSVINSLLAEHPGAGASAARVSSVGSSAVSGPPRTSTGLGGAAVRAAVVERPDPSSDPSPATFNRAPAPSSAGGVVESSRLKATTTAVASAVAQPMSRSSASSASDAAVRQGAVPPTPVATSGQSPVDGAASGSSGPQYQPRSVSSASAGASSVSSAAAPTTGAPTTAAPTTAAPTTTAGAVPAEPSTTAAVSSAPASVAASDVAAEPSTTPAVSTPAPSTLTPSIPGPSIPTPSVAAPSTPAQSTPAEVVASAPSAASSQYPAEAAPTAGAAGTAAGQVPAGAVAGAGEVVARPAVVTSAVPQSQAEAGRGGPSVGATQQWSDARQVGVAAAQPTTYLPGARTGVVAARVAAGISGAQPLRKWISGWRREGWR